MQWRGPAIRYEKLSIIHRPAVVPSAGIARTRHAEETL
jgi:hypothetical protein